MGWKKNRKAEAAKLRDLWYLPTGRHEWDCTLGSLAYALRIELDRSLPNLNTWAARHGVPPGGRYHELGRHALVLWHGTSRERAKKIKENGLFHKRGLWTTTNPGIAHSYCRWRSERFGTEGAVVCLVLNRSDIEEGKDFDIEGKGEIYRFHYTLGPEVVEYVLVKDEIRFTGNSTARHPTRWPKARFKRDSGHWVPIQHAPVRYSSAAQYSTPMEFGLLCLRRLAEELGEITHLEVFSVLYALMSPWEALSHDEVFELIHKAGVVPKQHGKWQTVSDPTPVG